jgi:hypothetical protein
MTDEVGTNLVTAETAAPSEADAPSSTEITPAEYKAPREMTDVEWSVAVRKYADAANPDVAKRALRKQWGADYAANMKFAVKAFHELIPANLRLAVELCGLASYAPAITWLSGIGRRLSDVSDDADTLHGGRGELPDTTIRLIAHRHTA